MPGLTMFVGAACLCPPIALSLAACPPLKTGFFSIGSSTVLPLVWSGLWLLSLDTGLGGGRYTPGAGALPPMGGPKRVGATRALEVIFVYYQKQDII